MNMLTSLANGALYALPFFAVIAASIIIALLSYVAYRETKFYGFLLWIVASVLHLCLDIGWSAFGLFGHHPPQVYYFAGIVYRVFFVVHAAISVAGTVLVIQRFRGLVKAGPI
jgi:hypothetical protein